MRFLHAADIHLDSPLVGLDDYEGAPVAAIRGATREAFINLVRLALDERVDFVVLAGDVYDGDWQDFSTGLFFVQQVKELAEAGIPLIMLSGNHDAASRITRRLTLPPSVHVLPIHRPGTITLENIRVAIHGQGYAEQAEKRNLVAEYPAPVPGFFNVGVLHTALDGREGHEPYAPCTLEQLVNQGYDYWALGHVHNRESVNGSAWVRVEYPGNIQGRHIRERGAKGCLLVSVDARRKCTTEFRALDVFRFEVVAVDATKVDSCQETLATGLAALLDVRERTEGRPLAARLQLNCCETVFQQIAHDLEHFRMDLAGQAPKDVWVEKVKVALVVPQPSVATAFSEDAATELREVLQELRGDLAAAQAVFTSGDCEKLLKTLPLELRTVFTQSSDDIFEKAAALLQAAPREEVS